MLLQIWIHVHISSMQHCKLKFHSLLSNLKTGSSTVLCIISQLKSVYSYVQCTHQRLSVYQEIFWCTCIWSPAFSDFQKTSIPKLILHTVHCTFIVLKQTYHYLVEAISQSYNKQLPKDDKKRETCLNVNVIVIVNRINGT